MKNKITHEKLEPGQPVKFWSTIGTEHTGLLTHVITLNKQRRQISIESLNASTKQPVLNRNNPDGAYYTFACFDSVNDTSLPGCNFFSKKDYQCYIVWDGIQYHAVSWSELGYTSDVHRVNITMPEIINISITCFFDEDAVQIDKASVKGVTNE